MWPPVPPARIITRARSRHADVLPSVGSTRWRRRLVPRTLALAAVATGGCVVAGTLPGDRLQRFAAQARDLALGAIEFVGHAQQQADRGARHQHARTAGGNQRQRQALGRQQAEVHADRHEALQARSTARRRTRSSPRSGGASRRTAARPRTRDPRAARYRPITSDDADQAEFFGDHREDEVGVRFGQVRQLLHRCRRGRRRTIRRGRPPSALASAGSRCRTDRPTDRGTR